MGLKRGQLMSIWLIPYPLLETHKVRKSRNNRQSKAIKGILNYIGAHSLFRLLLKSQFLNLGFKSPPLFVHLGELRSKICR